MHQRYFAMAFMFSASSGILAAILFLAASCKSESEYNIKTEDRYEVVDGKRELVEQVVQTFRKLDNRPVSKLTRVSNYDNDIRIEQLTGLTRDKGLREYLLDSIYYDSKGNDTLKIGYVHLGDWQRTQITRKTFRADGKVEYFVTERTAGGNTHFKKEIFYKYSPAGEILSETEFECSLLVKCDSLYKKTFRYDPNGGVDSVMYSWAEKKWSEVK